VSSGPHIPQILAPSRDIPSQRNALTCLARVLGTGFGNLLMVLLNLLTLLFEPSIGDLLLKRGVRIR